EDRPETRLSERLGDEVVQDVWRVRVEREVLQRSAAVIDALSDPADRDALRRRAMVDDRDVAVEVGAARTVNAARGGEEKRAVGGIHTDDLRPHAVGGRLGM